MTRQPDTQQQTEVAKRLGLDETVKTGARLRHWLVWGASAIVATVLALGWIRSDREPVQYETQAVKSGNLVVTVTATGNLQPTNQVDVGIEVSGTIRSVAVDYNDTVKVGQILARIDTTKLEAQVLQSQANLETARAKVLEAKATLEEARNQYARLTRMRALSHNELPSEQDLDSAKATLDRATAAQSSAAATVSQTSAALNAYRADLSKAAVRSPIDGIVLKRTVEPGQTVAATLQAPVLFTLAEDLAKMELHVDVDEADVGQVRPNQPAVFTVAAYPNQSFPARIIQVRYGSTTSSGVVTYEAVLKVDNSELRLRPGMTATAVITVNRIENATLVPNAALQFTPPVDAEDAGRKNDSILSKLYLRMPRPAPSHAVSRNGQQQVWILRDGKPEAIPVSIAATDGTLSALSQGDLRPGTPLLVDVKTSTRSP